MGRMPSGKKQNKNSAFPGISGTIAVTLIIAATLIGIAFPVVQADNVTVAATQTTVATTATTTVSSGTQTTSGTTVQTTATTAAPTSSLTTSETTIQTTGASSAQVAAVAWFDADPLYGSAPLGVQFTDTSTGTPTSWEWFFGDGTSAYVQNPYHVYTDPGTYTVSMNTVIGGMSYSATRNDLIAVRTAVTPSATTTATTTVTTTPGTGSGVEAAFFGSPRTGTAPLTVIFMDTSTGSPASWDWDFGDGETSTLQNPSHTYYEPGAYKVTLIVTGGETSDELALPNYITVVSPTSPITTVTTAPVSATGTTRAPATQAAFSSEETTAVPSGQNDQGGLFGYVIAIVVIAIIAGIAVIAYRRHNRYDMLK
jgi:PKD repeat protein